MPMARAIEQIERELATLSQSVYAIAAELNSAYTSYLTALGLATRQQLILASYQVCTQGHPKQFLSLSVSQRQHLQQAIRKLGKNSAQQLLEQLKTDEMESRGTEETEETEGGGEEKLSAAVATRPTNPIELLHWQHNLEEAIAHTLKTLSLEVNCLFQEAGILPQKLPSPLLEAATTASETVAEIAVGPPNLMNLLIETENPTDAEDSSMTQLFAIQLRLSEIEFADANVRSARNQIRQLEGKVHLLGREYQKKQRERIIAEAEAAWRSSWFED